MKADVKTQPLVDLGFTPVEAQVYLFLLTESPASGYRIAQATGKPASQTYRALEQLERKGVVIPAEGKTRLWRAVPVAMCLAHLERDFTERSVRAREALRDLPRPADDERVYRLTTRGQVIERCREMMLRAEKVVLLDLFPGPLREFRQDVEALAQRDVMVAAKVYEETAIDGVDLRVVPADAARVLEKWLGQSVNIAVDGRKFMRFD